VLNATLISPFRHVRCGAHNGLKSDIRARSEKCQLPKSAFWAGVTSFLYRQKRGFRRCDYAARKILIS
jgi:hypothetical protein